MESGLLSSQGQKRQKILSHNGSFKKKGLEYGTPKPRSSTLIQTLIDPFKTATATTTAANLLWEGLQCWA